MGNPIKLMGASTLTNDLSATPDPSTFSVDKISTDFINNNDIAFAQNGMDFHVYKVVTYGTNVPESLPLVIKPNDEGIGYKRWSLMNLYTNGMATNSLSGIDGSIDIVDDVMLSATLSATYIDTPTATIDSLTSTTIASNTVNASNATITTLGSTTATLTNANITTFTNKPSGITPTSDAHIATKKYIDDQIAALSASRGVPIGCEMFWPAGTTPPDGWKEENGDLLSTTTYATLFALIGYTYGGSGPSFKLPDPRGKYISVWDHGAGIDPDRGTRTKPVGGSGAIGDYVGNEQASQNKSHTHPHNINSDSVGGVQYSLYGPVDNVSNPLNLIGYEGGTNARPLNTSRMMIIKVL